MKLYGGARNVIILDLIKSSFLSSWTVDDVVSGIQKQRENHAQIP